MVRGGVVTPPLLSLSDSFRHHDAFLEVLEMRKATARDEIRRRKETIADLQRQCLDAMLDLQNSQGDGRVANLTPARRRSVSARLYPGPSSKGSAPSSHNTSTRPPLTPAEIAALGERLSPTPSPVVADLPPMDRRVVTSSAFRKKRPTSQTAIASFTDETAVRLACQDPRRRAENHERAVASVVLESKRRCTTHTSNDELRKTLERNYEAASLYAKQHDHMVNAHLKRVDEAIQRNCARSVSTTTFERLSRESDGARKRREQLEHDYVADFLPSGTAYQRKVHGGVTPTLPLAYEQRMYAELTKGHGFEWRRNPA